MILEVQRDKLYMGHEFSAVMLKDRKVNLKNPIQPFISNSIHTGLLSIRPWIINIEEEKMYNSKICYFGFIYGVEVDYLVKHRFHSNKSVYYKCPTLFCYLRQSQENFEW